MLHVRFLFLNKFFKEKEIAQIMLTLATYALYGFRCAYMGCFKSQEAGDMQK